MKNQKDNFKAEFQKRLIRFTVAVLQLCSGLRDDRNLWPITDQIARSAASIGANVSEAKGASSMRDYKRYFEIALKSANETTYWLTVIMEYDVGKNTKTLSLRNELEEIKKILNSAILTMKGRKKIYDS